MEFMRQPSICFASPKELQKLRNKSSFVPANVGELSNILNEIEIQMEMIAIISSNSETNAMQNAVLDEDKENVIPLNSPNSSHSSIDNDIDESGKPLPLQKLVNLSIVDSGTRFDQFCDQRPVTVRQSYSLQLPERLPEGRARTFLSNILTEIRRKSLPAWMTDGLAVIVPFADQSPPFTDLTSGLLIGAKGSSMRSFNVRCLQECITKDNLPELQDLKRRMAIMARSKRPVCERYETIFTLGAVSSDDDGGCHVTVRYVTRGESCSHLLERPTVGTLGQLLVRPLFGHPKALLHFIFEGIQRLKVLSTALANQATEWQPEGDMTAFSETLVDNFRQLCILSESGPDADVDCSLLTNPNDPAPRWRIVVARRKRDVTEVLWTVLRAVNSQKCLRQSMQTLLNYLLTEKLNYSVDRSNDTGLALVCRRLAAHGVPDLSNTLGLLIEAGFFALHRDLTAVLEAVCASHKHDLHDLEPTLRFFAEEGATSREERLRRLKRLHRACEFAALLSHFAPGADMGKNVRHVFSVLRNDAVDELVFNCVSSSFLSSDREVPTSWSVTMEYPNGLWIKQVFRRLARDVIDTYESSFAKFTHLEILSKIV